MWDRIKNSKIFDFIIRHLIWLVLFMITNIALWVYYKEFYWSIFFALIVSSLVMSVVLVWSNISVFVFTKLKITDDAAHILGQIFMGVCIVIAIVFGLVFWGKLGG